MNRKSHNFTTRPVSPMDVPEIVQIQRVAVDKAWRPMIPDFDVFLAERFNPEVQIKKYTERLNDPKRILMLVESDQGIAGFGGVRACEPDDTPPGYDYQATSFYIAPKFEGTGASLVLAKVLRDAMLQRGGYTVSGWCIASNRGARNFYKRCGGVLIENVTTPPDYAAVGPHVVYGWDLKKTA